MNPITRQGFFLATWPTWPWQYGTVRNPSGVQCALCVIVFRLGGFDAEHASMEAVAASMKTSASLTDEWLAVLESVIEGKNSGEIKDKMRGSIKDGVVSGLMTSRKKVVELIQSKGVRAREKFKAIALSRWAHLHPNSPDPKAAGFVLVRH